MDGVQVAGGMSKPVGPVQYPLDFLADLEITKTYSATEVVKGEAPAEEGRWVVEGFASTSDIDSQDHIIAPAALRMGAESLRKYKTLLFNHDPNRPIGYIENSEAREGKLFVKAVISKTEPKIWDQVKDGTLSKFSIFGRIRESEEGQVDGRDVLVIKALELFETSLVSVPANPEAKSLAWYIEKAIAAQQNGELPCLMPTSWVERIVKQSIEKTLKNQELHAEVVVERKDEGGAMKIVKKGMDLTAEIDALRKKADALEAGSNERQQMEANIRSLEALQKGQDTDPDNADRVAMVGTDGGSTSTMSHNTPDVHKADGDVAPVDLALESILALAATLTGQDKEMADRVAKWLEAKSGGVGEAVQPETKTASVTMQMDTSAMQPVLTEIRAIATQTVQAAKEAKDALASMQELFKGIPLRKGVLPVKEATDARNKETIEQPDPLKSVETAMGADRFAKMHPADRWRAALSYQVYGTIQ